MEIQFGNQTQRTEGSVPAITEGTHTAIQPEIPGTVEGEPTNEQIDVLQQRAREDLAQAQVLMDNPLEFEQGVIDKFIGDADVTEERGRA